MALYNKGVELFENKHYASAEKIFYEYLDTRDNNVAHRIDAQYYIAISAKELFQNDAESLLNAFREKYPEHPKAGLINYYLGDLLSKNSQYDRAAEAYEKVDVGALDEKQQAEYYFNAGYANFKTEKYDKAKSYFSKIKDTDNAYRNLGAYYYGYIAYIQKNYKEAIEEFLKVKDDKKFKAHIPEYITQIYLLQGKYDKVIEVGEESLKDSGTSNSAEVRLYVAEAYYLKKDYKNAAESFSSYDGSLNPHYLYELGYSRYMLEQYADALKAFNGISVDKDTLGQNVTYLMANCFVRTGDKLRARTAYDFAAQLKFSPVIQEQSMFNYAKVSYDMGFQKEGIEALRQYLKSYPSGANTAEAKELLGQMLLSTDDPLSAMQIIEGLQSRSPKLEEALQKLQYLYAIQLYQDKKYTEAEDYLNRSLTHPIDKKIKAQAWFSLGELRYRAGDYNAALKDYTNFLYVREATETSYYTLANYNIVYC
jgi:TolA-binding protein